VHRNCELALTAHTNSVTSVKWGGEGLIYSASRDTTVMVWNAENGSVVRQLKGHGHWVNTLALSSEYAVRTGPYDHKAEKPGNDDEAKAKALERYKTATGGKNERLISGKRRLHDVHVDPRNFEAAASADDWPRSAHQPRLVLTGRPVGGVREFRQGCEAVGWVHRDVRGDDAGTRGSSVPNRVVG
jgi:hypothetical protein